MSTTTYVTKEIPMSAGFSANPVLTRGDGPPTVYLHGLLGPEWNALLEGLAAKRRVFAPAHAGADEPEELRAMEGIYDLILYYDELFDKLGLQQFDLIGHSFGGMVAAEFAAAFPARVRKLVLIDSLGLWRDDAPVDDYLLCTPDKRALLLLGNPGDEQVRARLALPQESKEKIKAMVHNVTNLASTSHFLWPIPERGLKKRLHRIKAETLVLWGAEDKLVSSVYAKDFAAQIKGAKVEIVPGAGHTPHFTHCDAVLSKLNSFLEN